MHYKSNILLIILSIIVLIQCVDNRNLFFKYFTKDYTIIDDAQCSVDDIKTANERLSQILNQLVKKTFFKIFKVDLKSPCPFWVMKQMCGLSGGCDVCVCDESEVPIPWKINKTNPVNKNLFGIINKWEDDNKYLWFKKQREEYMTYVNLLLNPEGNTGYKGEEAARVWRAIYNENCFKGKIEDMCLEQRVFYRLISGLHTSITMHIAYNYYKQKDEFNVNDGNPVFTPNYEMYKHAIAKFPDRIKNLYFIFTFMLRAIQKASDFISEYNYTTGNEKEDEQTQILVKQLVDDHLLCGPTFDESLMFRGAEKKFLMGQMRDHFRNISSIMDCVACEKCKMWGKLQTLGLSVALKIVLSEDTDECISGLQRNELIAFINTVRQLSESIRMYEDFQRMEKYKPISSYISYGMVILIIIITTISLFKSFKKK